MKKIGVYTIQQKNGQTEILTSARYMLNYFLLYGLIVFVGAMRLHLSKKRGHYFLHENLTWLLPLGIFSAIGLGVLTYAIMRKTTIRVQGDFITVKKATSKKEIALQNTKVEAKPSFKFDKSYYNVYLTTGNKKVTLIEHTSRKKGAAIAEHLNKILFV